MVGFLIVCKGKFIKTLDIEGNREGNDLRFQIGY
jgi:hypothetical protein